jgi:hypothetical protein
MNTGLTTTEPTTLQAAYGAFSPAVIKEQIQLIQQVISEAMIEGQHFGIIPGTSRKDKDGKEISKPTLLKPGAEKLALMFRLAPEFEVEVVDLGGKGHREYRVKCRLLSINTGAFTGSGVGSCSTMESKYRYRSGRRKCPSCGSEAIVLTKKGRNPGGYWCVPDKGGCNANFDPGDPDVEKQEVGKVENPDIADVYNTCLKMAKKRALVDAVITATAASDCFAQDLEDLPHAEEEPRSAPVEVRPAPAKPDKIGPPKTGTELHARLSAKDAELARQGLIRNGELLEYVRNLGMTAAGAPKLFSDWNKAQIALAVGAVGPFIQACRDRQAEEKESPAEQPEQGDANEEPVEAVNA